ncbi:MAG: BrnT family toxin [bacterium]|nr:BrnT family toxin [bacterium]
MGDSEWDTHKAEANLHKHGVSFGEAATVFADPLALDRADPDHSEDEERFLCVGRSYVDRLLVVAYAERGDRIRIVTARVAEPRERRAYERPKD